MPATWANARTSSNGRVASIQIRSFIRDSYQATISRKNTAPYQGFPPDHQPLPGSISDAPPAAAHVSIRVAPWFSFIRRDPVQPATLRPHHHLVDQNHEQHAPDQRRE